MTVIWTDEALESLWEIKILTVFEGHKLLRLDEPKLES